MKSYSIQRISPFLLFFFVAVSAQNMLTCRNRWSPCFRRVIRCPTSCPYTKPSHPDAKACFLDCNSPKCEATCRGRKPSCSGVGSGCYDPRFIGSDGVVFYFHGKKGEHFSLVSDPSLQINARFIGLRPSGRTRDFTWIHALGLIFGPHTFTIEANHVNQWNDLTDHFNVSFNSEPVHIAAGYLSEWKSYDDMVKVERTSDDCFAHLEVQFRFFKLSTEVEGVLGRTYRPGFENPAKKGVEMPVVGGEDNYRTSSLLSSDCKMCIFSPEQDS